MGSKKSNGESYGTGRTRNYACVVYLDSAPENWLSIISDAKIPCFVSPLHDEDVNPTGEPKKPHHHVLAMWDSVKTKDQAQAFFDTFKGVGCESVNSSRGYARYLCHLDNPEKAQYSPEKVKCFGGANYSHIIGTMADKGKCVREMIAFVREQDITCFSDLMDYSATNNEEWFDCLINAGAYVIKEYIKSYTWKYHKLEETEV